jgi:hypothetical protein
VWKQKNKSFSPFEFDPTLESQFKALFKGFQSIEFHFSMDNFLHGENFFFLSLLIGQILFTWMKVNQDSLVESKN